MAGGRLSWMEIISVLFCVCACVFGCDYIYLIASGREELVWSVGGGEETRGLAGGDWASNNRSFARLRLGRDGGARKGGGALRVLVLSALLFLFTDSVFSCFNTGVSYAFFSVSLIGSTHTATTSPQHRYTSGRRQEREMDRYLAQGRSGQHRTKRWGDEGEISGIW